MAGLQRDSLGVLQQYQHELGMAGRWLLDLSVGILGAVVELFLGVIVAAMIRIELGPISRRRTRTAVTARADQEAQRSLSAAGAIPRPTGVIERPA